MAAFMKGDRPLVGVMAKFDQQVFRARASSKTFPSACSLFRRDWAHRRCAHCPVSRRAADGRGFRSPLVLPPTSCCHFCALLTKSGTGGLGKVADRLFAFGRG